MTESPLNNRSLNSRSLLEKIRDVVVIVMSVSVLAVCIAVVVVFVLFSPLLHSVDNIESATESLAGVAEGLTTLSEDASVEIISISDGFDTITVNVETATQDIAELADDLADIAGRSAN